MTNEVMRFLSEGKHLPDFMKDFHDQKDLFKLIQYVYENGSHEVGVDVPNWRDAQVYTIDWFLWFMASRGYTLQKNRSKIEFERPIFSIREYQKEIEGL